MKIYIAGHTGMVGSAISRAVDSGETHDWIGASRSELDLTNRENVFDFLLENKPDAVIIAAAKVGGIVANDSYPVNFLSENLLIQTNLMDGAHKADIKKLVFLGSSCIYPKFSAQPIKESSLLTGEFEPTNESYAVAKIAGVKLVEAYRKQYGRGWISLMPTNLYGPGDNYDPVSSHVIPGMITKFLKAKENNEASVTLWGTGSPMREFMYVDDLASATLFSLDNFRGGNLLNVGSGEEVSIKNLAYLIRDVIQFSGDIKWDKSKPDGVQRKLLDSSRLASMGWTPSMSLRRGLEQTILGLELNAKTH